MFGNKNQDVIFGRWLSLDPRLGTEATKGLTGIGQGLAGGIVLDHGRLGYSEEMLEKVFHRNAEVYFPGAKMN